MIFSLMTRNAKIRKLVYEKLLITALLLLVLSVTFYLYRQLADHVFVSLDDSLYVFDNDRVVSGLSPDNFIWAFQTMKAEFWHPLTWLSYMLDTELYGVQPGAYLLTNLLLHLFNSAMVFICFRRLTGRLWESWVISLLFALHPLHVEPVAWVSGRKELLCVGFWLLAILAYDEYRRSPGWRRYLAVAVFFAMGLMAKPMIVTLPFLLLLLDYWPLCRDTGHESGDLSGGHRFRRWRTLVIEKVPLFGICLAGIIIAVVAQQQGGGLVSTESFPLMSRISHVLAAYALYLKKSIWPGALTVFYPMPVLNSGILITTVAVLAAITVGVICLARRQRYLLTGWFWFLGTLVPVIGIVKVGEFFIADRYMYMPLTGILIMVVFSLKSLLAGLSHRRLWMIVIPVMLSGVYAPITFFQIQTWQDSETLYRHALAVTENNYLAHHALGNVLAVRNDKAGAIEQFSKAVEIRPDRAPLWVTLGKARAFDQQWTKAEEAFNRAALLEPDHPAAWFYMGCGQIALGDIPQALALLTKSLEKARKGGQQIDTIYDKAMDFYQKGLYYESRGGNAGCRSELPKGPGGDRS